ncbi:nucleotidyltransferase [Nakamurella leprariae]|uniref:Nucleotidyltransferase n=1 Tax=Nakamurella leprariae TaxID=2803911 RepID=A0A939C2S5_9ACTN|nr:nucleotidyltransferase [Nakamurella leprariae]MBM9468402.1 nucleotidyltransferase [Nakamurella leprariae]
MSPEDTETVLDPDQPTDPPLLRAALKVAASALKAEGIRFALAGSYALWVHGAPENTHDVDLMVRPAEVEQAAEVLAAAGFSIRRPPEDWLFKAFLDGAMVDVLHQVNNRDVDDATLADAAEEDVLGLHIPVLSANSVITGKLRAMSERYCDFGSMLPAVRAVREQLDWDRIRRDTEENPFAEAFLVLADRLGISPDPDATAAPQR